jgi:hypothetical protein
MHKGQLESAYFALFLTLAAVGGCSGSFQGTKFRAQAPNIDDAFRRISLAITTDGYAFESVDPASHSFITGWRELTSQELSESDRKAGQQKIKGRIVVRMASRGKLYDIYLTPVVRYESGNMVTPETVPDRRHPFREKWEKVIRQLVELEAREED